METQTSVIVRVVVEGFHRFPGAELVFGNEVNFLSNRHRHLFYIIAEKKVFHDNRDVEFILFKRDLQQYINSKYGQPAEFGNMSCEAIARDMMESFHLESCVVLEDNENGAKMCKV